MKDELRGLVTDWRAGAAAQAGGYADGLTECADDLAALLAQPEAADSQGTTCVRCGGSGTVTAFDQSLGPDAPDFDADCPDCGGTGDVHRLDGEYVGRCNCKPEAAGALAGEAIAEVAAFRIFIGDGYRPDFDAAIAALSAAPVAAQQPAVVGDSDLESLIEGSEGHWQEDEFRIEASGLMALLRSVAATTPAATPAPAGGEGGPDWKAIAVQATAELQSLRLAQQQGPVVDEGFTHVLRQRALVAGVVTGGLLNRAADLLDARTALAHSPQDGRKGEEG